MPLDKKIMLQDNKRCFGTSSIGKDAAGLGKDAAGQVKHTMGQGEETMRQGGKGSML